MKSQIITLLILINLYLANSAEYWVDGANGDDYVNDGSENSPWAHIAKALSQCAEGDTVRIKPYLYTESITINKNNLKIRGETGAKMKPEQGQDYVINITGVNQCLVEGIDIESGITSRQIAAININDSGKVKINDVKIGYQLDSPIDCVGILIQNDSFFVDIDKVTTYSMNGVRFTSNSGSSNIADCTFFNFPKYGIMTDDCADIEYRNLNAKNDNYNDNSIGFYFTDNANLRVYDSNAKNCGIGFATGRNSFEYDETKTFDILGDGTNFTSGGNKLRIERCGAEKSKIGFQFSDAIDVEASTLTVTEATKVGIALIDCYDVELGWSSVKQMIDNYSNNWLAPGLYIFESRKVEAKVLEFDEVGIAVQVGEFYARGRDHDDTLVIHENSTEDSTEIQVKLSTIKNCTWGMKIDKVDDITVSDIQFVDEIKELGILVAGGEDIKINDNHFNKISENETEAIKITQGRNITINKNQFFSSKYGIHITNEAKEGESALVITGVTMTQNYFDSFYFYILKVVGEDGTNIADINFNQNIFVQDLNSLSNEPGIVLKNVEDFEIEENRFKMNEGKLFIQGNGADLADSDIDYNEYCYQTKQVSSVAPETYDGWRWEDTYYNLSEFKIETRQEDYVKKCGSNTQNFEDEENDVFDQKQGSNEKNENWSISYSNFHAFVNEVFGASFGKGSNQNFMKIQHKAKLDEENTFMSVLQFNLSNIPEYKALPANLIKLKFRVYAELLDSSDASPETDGMAVKIFSGYNQNKVNEFSELRDMKFEYSAIDELAMNTDEKWYTFDLTKIIGDEKNDFDYLNVKLQAKENYHTSPLLYFNVKDTKPFIYLDLGNDQYKYLCDNGYSDYCDKVGTAGNGGNNGGNDGESNNSIIKQLQMAVLLILLSLLF